MQSKSITGTETSGMNKMISNSGVNKQLSTPSRGRGRGRGKRQVCDVGVRDTEAGPQQASGKQHPGEACQKLANENPRKKTSSKTRKPDQALYVPKSRKPDQALYVPRSRRNEKVLTSELSATTNKSIEKTELSEKPVKRTQNTKSEPPPKKKNIDKKDSALHVESEDIQEYEQKTNVEENVAMSMEEHKETNVTDVFGSSKIKDHGILEKNMSENTLPSVSLSKKDKLPEGVQSNRCVAMEVESQEFENEVLLGEEILGEEINEYQKPSNKPDSNNKRLLEETGEMASDNMSSQEETLLCDTDCTEDLFEKHSADNYKKVSTESSLENEHHCGEKQDHENEEPITGMITQDQTNVNVTKPSENIQKCSDGELQNLTEMVEQNTEVHLTDLHEGHCAINLETVQKGNCQANKKEEDSWEEEKLSELSKPTMDDLGKNEEFKKNIAEAEVSIDICSDVANEDTAELSEDGDDWDSLFDESGEALSSETLDQISEGIGNVKVSVKKTKQDYYNYHAKDNFDYGKFSHVIEIYDFPAEFKTVDLIQSFSGYRIKGFDIQWVDDTHALGIFSSSSIAQDALGLQNPMLRTRSLSQATRESKLKARKCVDFLQPVKSRPETSASAARRLVSGALGLKSKETKEQRATELKKLKEAKEKKRTDKRITEDIWEGNTWRL